MSPGEDAPKQRAAVDVGTNSVRLLIRDATGSTVAREMEITRLGRDVDRTGHLDDGGLEATLRVLASYRAAWERYGVEDVRIAATSAVRDAADSARFLSGVREVAGVAAHVLSGEDEAAIAYLGATSGLDVDRPTAILDVGGGSTEVIVGDGGGRLEASVSLQLGCVRLAERCLPSDPPRPDELAEGRREVRARLDAGARDLAAHGADPSRCATLVGVAGTVTTLAALHLGLDVYDPERIHATAIPAPAVRELTDRLAAMTIAQRAELGPMARGREDVIVAGALVVEGALERFGFEAITASETDILDGLLLTPWPR
jgi:exopolyphosphatase / guanosine-5'-triphosphate,3'-diphosphate pyrophosphatase